VQSPLLRQTKVAEQHGPAEAEGSHGRLLVSTPRVSKHFCCWLWEGAGRWKNVMRSRSRGESMMPGKVTRIG
jgi:hypothetical protein